MAFTVQALRRFHLLRLVVWTAQVPVACLTPLKSSVVYLVFLSVAALVESSLTDYVQARQLERENPHAKV